MENMIELFHTAGNLKNVKRKGWILKGIKDGESVAEHSFRTTFMCMMLAERFGVGRERCACMALVHDLAESIVGDITPHDGISKEEKSAKERKAIEKLSDASGEILELWEEYEKNNTKEAKFVHDMDRLEMALQAFEYGKAKNADLTEFWDFAEKSLESGEVKKIFKIIRQNANRDAKSI